MLFKVELNFVITFSLILFCTVDYINSSPSNYFKKGDKKVKKYNQTEVLLLGFDSYKYDRYLKRTGFFMYFVPVKSRIYPKNIIISTIIKYKEGNQKMKSNVRTLDNYEIDVPIKCIQKGNDYESIQKFWCSFKPKRKILNIDIYVNELKVENQDVKIKGSSPLATRYLDNIQNCSKTKIFNQPIYILNKAKKVENNTSINITGKIKEDDFNYNTLELLIASIDKTTEKTVNCDIFKVKKKYTISCTPKEEMNGDLDASFSFLGDRNLIINFDEDEESIFEFHYNSSLSSLEIQQQNFNQPLINLSFSNFIILALFLVFISFFFYFFKGKGKEEQIDEGKMEVVKITSS